MDYEIKVENESDNNMVNNDNKKANDDNKKVGHNDDDQDRILNDSGSVLWNLVDRKSILDGNKKGKIPVQILVPAQIATPNTEKVKAKVNYNPDYWQRINDLVNYTLLEAQEKYKTKVTEFGRNILNSYSQDYLPVVNELVKVIKQDEIAITDL